MLGELLESSPRPVRRRLSTFLSFTAHLVIGGAAVAAARPVPEEPPVRSVITWHPPAPPPPPQCTICDSPSSGGSRRSQRGRISLPDFIGHKLTFDVVAEGIGPVGDTLTISQSEWRGTPAGESRDSASPFSAGAVDREVIPFTTNPAPRYPVTLREAGISGTVRMRFVVDTTGRVRMETVVVEAADHRLFADAVIGALRQARFTPAELRGRKVAQLVVQPFVFVLRS